MAVKYIKVIFFAQLTEILHNTKNVCYRNAFEVRLQISYNIEK